MLDTTYIQELSEMTKKREAKDLLFDYAASFNITLKKNATFEEMVDILKEEFTKLENEPLPEDNDGISITDLISAADVSDGTDVFNEGAKEEIVQLLVDEPTVNDLVVEEVKEEEKEPEDNKPLEETVTVEQQEEIKTFELPKNFSPSVILLGSNPNSCYATLPWWIYEWIAKTPDWKENPDAFPHYHGINTLYSLIYYIKRDGYVRIRETKNSSFVILD